MAINIPFVREFEFEYGESVEVAEGVRRVICKNPSAFTFTGTGTYILGKGEVAVVDPGPISEEHLDAILRAVKGERVTHILITHTHMDHSPLTSALQEATLAVSYGFGSHDMFGNEDEAPAEEDGDGAFVPDEFVVYGDYVGADTWEVECVHTPGHTSNHMCYQLTDSKALFTGDHVMGWSTSIVSPPDGNMSDYMRSLELLLKRDDEIYWPTHGTAITKPKAHVRAFIQHRLEREDQIKGEIRNGVHRIVEMVPNMYKNVGQHLHPAAARSVFAAVLHMIEKGDLRCEGEPTISSDFYF